MTTTQPDTHSTPPATEPLALKLNEGLGPLLPARCNAGTARFAHNDATPLWTEHEVRTMLAAERERCARLCDDAKPQGGRMWTDEQAACFDCLTHVADAIRA